MDLKIRMLRADEIELRTTRITDNGSQWLLFKDSRCDKKILDETFGVFGWQNSYREIKGNLFCTISVYDKETGYWIDKEDVGVESFAEKEKGEASDAFKRACFNLGIGRELYTKIYIWVPSTVLPTEQKEGKWRMKGYPQLRVDELEIDEINQKITHITIYDDNSKQTVFKYTSKKPNASNIMEALNNMVNEFAPKLECTTKTLSNSIIKKFGDDITKYDIGELKLFLLKKVQAKNAKN